jgi:hypothetical protein
MRPNHVAAACLLLAACLSLLGANAFSLIPIAAAFVVVARGEGRRH